MIKNRLSGIGRTLVAWAGINTGASDESAFFAEFEAMLKSVQFR